MTAALAAAWLAAAPATAAEGKKAPMPDLQEKLRAHVFELAERIGERNAFKYKPLRDARDYVLGVFGGYGFAASTQPYTIWENTFENVVAVLPGSGGAAAGTLVVGAHYDTAPGTPGADDNASGVAGLLELARLMRAAAPRKTIVFAAFASEEPPFFGTDLMGSRVFAAAARAKGEPIEAMISLEMIGYYDKRPGSQRYPPLVRFFFPDTGDFISLVGNFGSRSFLTRLRDALKRRMRLPLEYASLPAWVPGVDWSDHASFWQEGYPAVMLTDTSFYRNRHYHEGTDRYDTLDYASMAAFVEGLAAALEELAR